jgi:L-rhamnose mutarotase
MAHVAATANSKHRHDMETNHTQTHEHEHEHMDPWPLIPVSLTRSSILNVAIFLKAVFEAVGDHVSSASCALSLAVSLAFD